jgi:hypothetical protein
MRISHHFKSPSPWLLLLLRWTGSQGIDRLKYIGQRQGHHRRKTEVFFNGQKGVCIVTELLLCIYPSRVYFLSSIIHCSRQETQLFPPPTQWLNTFVAQLT